MEEQEKEGFSVEIRGNVETSRMKDGSHLAQVMEKQTLTNETYEAEVRDKDSTFRDIR